jgi:hypothetical protein
MNPPCNRIVTGGFLAEMEKLEFEVAKEKAQTERSAPFTIKPLGSILF